MADVLFVTWDGGGNLPPALGIAGELRRRGHQVGFLGHPQQREQIESAGCGFTPYAHARPWSSTQPVDGLRAAVRIFTMFTDRGPGVDLLETLERSPADLVVLDCMSLGALAAAQRAGLRRAVLMHTYHRFLTHSWSSGPIWVIARLKGRHPMRMWNSADLVLVATDRDLDPATDADLPPSVRHVGVVQPPPLPAPGPSGSESRPRVLVSLSTTYFTGQDAALQSIIDALAGLPVHALVTTGPVDPGRLRAPAHVELHRHLPHADVMPGARLVIGHGGHATTMRALAHDLPLVIMPMHAMLDQKMIGRSVQAQGAATVLSRKASADEIRAAVQTMLTTGPHTVAAARLGARLRSRDGAIVAADQLCALLPQPVEQGTGPRRSPPRADRPDPPAPGP